LNGKYRPHQFGTDYRDLINAPEKRTVWLCVNRGPNGFLLYYVYESEDLAKVEFGNRLTRIPVEIEIPAESP
jgi:hypothetical protein